MKRHKQSALCLSPCLTPYYQAYVPPLPICGACCAAVCPPHTHSQRLPRLSRCVCARDTAQLICIFYWLPFNYLHFTEFLATAGTSRASPNHSRPHPLVASPGNAVDCLLTAAAYAAFIFN